MNNPVEYIKADCFRVTGKKFSKKNLLKALRSKGFKYLFFMRLRSHKSVFIRGFSFLILRILMYRYGFQIPSKTEIGPGFFIGHFGTVVISVNSKIGKNCNIAHGTTIGAARGKRAGAPTIGDDVWIGTGAVLVGNIHVDSNVLIAPNSFVNENIPSNSIVIGNPAKIIAKKNPTKNYINNRWKD